METWEAVIAGIFAVLLLLWLGPGAKRAIEESRRGTRDEWMGALLPIGGVVLFVVLLLALARG